MGGAVDCRSGGGKGIEERRALPANELNHRVKNTLVVVQSLTRR
ncbi:HWE histidine kinase domain-containing protein [Roseicella aerolata]|uniref:histidine kinase n=1 Tax=Roseicella aerolata TaxID=2883479 RepID=A0A9X1IHI0_9PROT|nr:hypothetical protein [Roseicella aerolata]